MALNILRRLCGQWHFALRLLLMVLVPVQTLAGDFFNLIDEQTGQPLMQRVNGYPEPFLFLFEGPRIFRSTISGQFIEMQGVRPVGLDVSNVIDYRFQLKDSGRWVRVEKWPYKDYEKYTSKAKQQPGVVRDYSIYLSKELDRHLDDRRGWLYSGDLELEGCMPFIFDPIFVLDPVTHKPLWAKFYAVARTGFDPSFKSCERDAWHILAEADVENFPEPGAFYVSALDRVEGQGGSGPIVTLKVSAYTGEIIDGATPGMKAIDVADVLRFKDEYFKQHRCPNYSERERQQARKDKNFINTAAGRCVTQRLRNYAEAVLTHFFGQALPPLKKSPHYVEIIR